MSYKLVLNLRPVRFDEYEYIRLNIYLSYISGRVYHARHGPRVLSMGASTLCLYKLKVRVCTNNN